jgi:hypothetical protein
MGNRQTNAQVVTKSLAELEAEKYLHKDEIVLDDLHPVYAGYMYVIEFMDGEVDIVNADKQGTVRNLKNQIFAFKTKKAIRHIRRCNISSRELMSISHYDLP